MKRFLFIIQAFIKCALIFLIAFIWLRFIFDAFWLSLIISFVITLVIELLSVFLTRKKGAKNNLKIKEKEDAENMFFSLAQDKNRLDFFYSLAKSRHSNVLKLKNYIEISHNDSAKVILYPFMKFQKLTQDDILEITNGLKTFPDKLVITCNEYDKSILNFVKSFSFDIVVIDKYETYFALYKEYDFYPEITVFQKQTKYSFKDFLSYSFNRSKTKGYLLSALALFVISFFVQMSVYYCIIATLLLFFALLSFTNKTYNKKIEKELL